VREAASLVKLCREKIHAAEVQVKTITEQLERETSAIDDEP
jgi:exodeoxyribonuclease VII small subunit